MFLSVIFSLFRRRRVPVNRIWKDETYIAFVYHVLFFDQVEVERIKASKNQLGRETGTSIPIHTDTVVAKKNLNTII